MSVQWMETSFGSQGGSLGPPIANSFLFVSLSRHLISPPLSHFIPSTSLILQSKVENVKLLSNLNNNIERRAAVFNAHLIPCHTETGKPLYGHSVAAEGGRRSSNNNDGGAEDDEDDDEEDDVEYLGNDELYLRNDASPPPFQLRVTVSRATEGLAAKEYYEALFARAKQMAEEKGGSGSGGGIGGISMSELVEVDDDLRSLKEKVEYYANRDSSETKEGEKPLGYYVEVLLLEPHVKETDVVIAPPLCLDKSSPATRYPDNHSDDENKEDDETKCIFQDIFASTQFTTAPGPWEQANIRAYENMVLDVRKALVRVEFPVFPEGCKDKTFREVYQLNARVGSCGS